MNEVYLKAARLMVQVAPIAFQSGAFALKGGSAINLFVRDLPRLSVDLDLVFVDHTLPRDKALARINAAIRQAADRLKGLGFQVRTVTAADSGETKVLVRRDDVEVKIEVNFVMRGTVGSPRVAALSAKSREILQADLEIPIVAMEDLYGSKLVAAMDRQHPRDLFDVMHLFAHEGITPAIRRSFVVYLACHNRPTHEVLFPQQRDITLDFERNFRGMTLEPVEIADLLKTRERLIGDLQRSLEKNEREFLISLVRNTPKWELLEVAHLQDLPGLRWKILNIGRLAKTNPAKFAAQAESLEKMLG